LSVTTRTNGRFELAVDEPDSSHLTTPFVVFDVGVHHPAAAFDRHPSLERRVDPADLPFRRLPVSPDKAAGKQDEGDIAGGGSDDPASGDADDPADRIVALGGRNSSPAREPSADGCGGEGEPVKEASTRLESVKDRQNGRAAGRRHGSPLT
jgi:hypothetical protein